MRTLHVLLTASLALLGLFAGGAAGQAETLGVSSSSHVEATAFLFLPTGLSPDGEFDVDATAWGDAGGTLTVQASGGDHHGGTIAIAAAPGTSYGVSLPHTLTVAGQAIALSRFHANLPLAGELMAGHHDLAVGATISLAPHVPPGRYAAVFDLTIQNN